MRTFFQGLRRSLGMILFGMAFLLCLSLPVQAARCGCGCLDFSIQTGTVAGTCGATTCTATCTTACTAHGGVSTASCGEDPAPTPTSGPLCICSCGEGMRTLGAPGGTCGGGDASCNALCTTECSGHGAFSGASCDSGETSVPTPGSCVTRALTREGMSTARRGQQEAIVSRIEGAAGGAPRTTWTCQSLPSDQIDANHCVPLGCTGTPFCCVPGTGSAPVTTSEGATSGDAAGVSDGSTPAPTQPCAELAVTRGTTQATVDAVARQTGTDPSVWACQRVCTSARRSSCVEHGCPGTDAAILCCPPSIGQPVGLACGARGASGETDGAGDGGGIGIARLILPNCATTHDPRTAGKCQIADVFDLGYAAVRFMFGLSGALLLVAFVVSGFKYLVNGYAGDIKAAKETMVNATLGIVIMLFAYIVVTFLYNALTQ